MKFNVVGQVKLNDCICNINKTYNARSRGTLYKVILHDLCKLRGLDPDYARLQYTKLRIRSADYTQQSLPLEIEEEQYPYGEKRQNPETGVLEIFTDGGFWEELDYA